MVRWAQGDVFVSHPHTGGASVLARLRTASPQPAVRSRSGSRSLAFEALALRPVLFDREPPIQGIEVVFSLVGGSFAACSLIAWQRRPDSRSGMLMTATGFLFFVSPLLSQVDNELVSTLRVFFVDYWIFPFVALILTLLTSGRLQTRFDRLLVASYLVPLGIGQLAWMMTDPEEGYLLLAWPDADVAARHRPGPARPARGPLLGDDRRGRRQVVEGVAAAAPRAAAEPRRRLRAAVLRRRCWSTTSSPAPARRRCSGSPRARS